MGGGRDNSILISTRLKVILLLFTNNPLLNFLQLSKACIINHSSSSSPSYFTKNEWIITFNNLKNKIVNQQKQLLKMLSLNENKHKMCIIIYRTLPTVFILLSCYFKMNTSLILIIYCLLSRASNLTRNFQYVIQHNFAMWYSYEN